MSDVEAQPPKGAPTGPARDSEPRKRSRSPRRGTDSYRGGGAGARDSDYGRDRNRDRGMDDRRDDRRGDRADRGDRDRDDRPRPRKKNFGGFAYKDKRRDEGGRDDRDRDDDRRGGGSYRGYRDRSRSPRRRPRDRDEDRDRGGRDDRRGGRSEDTTKPPKRPAAASSSSNAAAAAPNQGFIVVWVNDRLGTKEAIPCLPSDTVGQFKILVASRIGRKPHEIKLQKQGERPLKDMITLADYEISNGRQLDLEVGTGD
ncbi:hypothetical protein JX265_003095 [Neoarthrinium moseri]|uniref:Ubiquitin-like modifier HUB1 n=1 Tax=Neoarthrinium moseri TaxID=1658444 RepID=A0A9Q0APX6_9PEZI|nr:hypothetical protein JX265_003095 [Neoarthrinium moseri]